jgi:hypothetical protein
MEEELAVRERFWGAGVPLQFFHRDVWANFELIAVLVLAAGKFVIGDLLGQHVWFAVAGGGLCITYIAVRLRSTPGLTEVWGFSRTHMRDTFAVVLPVAAVGISAAVWYGLASGTAVLHWHMIPVLLLYPAWGTVQQFLLVVMVAGNIDRITRGHLPRGFIILPTAILFALIHIPVLTLMAATFFMGAFTTALFLRYRSVWALGLFHGLLATALYYFVLGQDPLRNFSYLAG